jgi:hypothetical protein
MILFVLTLLFTSSVISSKNLSLSSLSEAGRDTVGGAGAGAEAEAEATGGADTTGGGVGTAEDADKDEGGANT